VGLAVNDVQLEATLEPRTSLADFLRLHRHLTGTHLGCEHGVCGACTIMLNGNPARSCISLAVSLDGTSVRTIEGFDADRVMAALREAFHEEHALQCGFCTSGMLVTARDIVGRLAEADEKRIRAELAGNLCRCTGYVGIVNAIQRVMSEVPPAVRMGAARGRGAHAPRPSVRPFQAFIAKSATPRLAASAAAGFSLEVVPALEKSWSRIIDHIFVARPRAEVWAFLSDVRRVASCMPGAELASEDGRMVEGRVRVAFGLIKATFAGSATIERNDADMVGVISGTGGDDRARSRVKGRVSYVVLEAIGAAAGTRVELVLDYQLQGPLAQFARTGLVRAFASQMIAEFAANLSAALAGGPVERAPSASSFGAGSVLWRSVVAQLKRWVCRVARR
jgi:carbon-monoxide dehydrogenase small subunit